MNCLIIPAIHYASSVIMPNGMVAQLFVATVKSQI